MGDRPAGDKGRIEDEDTWMCVCTWNTDGSGGGERGEEKVTAVEDLAIGAGADIILLQEVIGLRDKARGIRLPRALAETCRRLGYRAHLQPHESDQSKAGLRHCLVTMWHGKRYAMQGAGRRLAPRCGGVDLLRLRDQRFVTVVNIHGTHGDVSARRAQIRAAFEDAAEGSESIVGGDFNAVPCELWRSSRNRLDEADAAFMLALAPEQRCNHAECACAGGADERAAAVCGACKAGADPAAVPTWTRKGNGALQHQRAAPDGIYTLGAGCGAWHEGGRGGHRLARFDDEVDTCVAIGMSYHLPVLACREIPDAVSVLARPIPTVRFGEREQKQVRKALGAGALHERRSDEDSGAWLERLSSSLVAAVQSAEQARRHIADQSVGGAARADDNVESDYKHALELRRIAEGLVDSFDERKFWHLRLCTPGRAPDESQRAAASEVPSECSKTCASAQRHSRG